MFHVHAALASILACTFDRSIAVRPAEHRLATRSWSSSSLRAMDFSTSAAPVLTSSMHDSRFFARSSKQPKSSTQYRLRLFFSMAEVIHLVIGRSFLPLESRIVSAAEIIRHGL